MKKNVIFVLCMILYMTAFGQSKTNVSNEVSNVTTPKFTGSENVNSYLKTDNSVLIDNYIKENLVCPKQAAECCIEGTEVVQFSVSPSGKISDIKIVNGLCPELDKEVVRVLKTTDGMWQPALKNGEPVAMKSEIKFMLGDYSSKSLMVKSFVKKAAICFSAGSRTLLVKNNPKKALRYYNKAIRYMPDNKEILSHRGICHYELGDKVSAQRDWNRIVALGGIEPTMIDQKIAGMEGYEEMKETLSSK